MGVSFKVEELKNQVKISKFWLGNGVMWRRFLRACLGFAFFSQVCYF
jgi:hypothetical protein